MFSFNSQAIAKPKAGLTMRSVYVLNQGQSAEDLSWGESEEPILNAGEVLIKTAYFGINRPDILQRRGLYPLPLGASPVLGLEVSGHITKLGGGVDAQWLGRPVMALCHGGAYAGLVKVDVGHLMPIPDGWSLAEAASLPEAMVTVYANLVEDGGLKAGDKVLVHGGNSGIGSMAIMVSKALGAQCASTARGAIKCDFATKCGADLVINNEGDFGWTKKLSSFGPVDIVLDMLGGDYVAHNLMNLAPLGRHISIAFQSGAQAQLPLGLIMARRLKITGSLLRPRSSDEKSDLIERAMRVLKPYLDAKTIIRPVVQQIYEANDIVKSHQDLEDGLIMGKAVIKLAGAEKDW